MKNKESKEKGFLMFYDNEIIVCRLPDDEAGKLIKALFQYAKKSIVPDFEYSVALAMAFDVIKMSIDRGHGHGNTVCRLILLKADIWRN